MANNFNVPTGSESPLEGKCGAKLRKTDPPRYCKDNPAPGRTRCYRHGGKSLIGIDHPSTITGRYSKDLPTRLAARYQERVDDPEILSLVPEIALLDTKLGELLSNAAVAVSTWDTLRAELAELREAIRDEDTARAQAALRQLSVVISEGAADASKWRDIVGLVKERRSLVDTERKLAFEESNAVRLDQLLVLKQMITMIILKYVVDKADREAIGTELARVFS